MRARAPELRTVVVGQSPAQKKARADRMARVVELHARGVTFPQIADMKIPGIGSKQQAHKLWTEALEEMPRIKVEEYRMLENMRLDNLERKLQTVVMGTGADPKDVVRGAQTLINLYKRRADLNGLDLRPTDGGPVAGAQIVFADMSVLNKTLRAPGEVDDDGDTE